MSLGLDQLTFAELRSSDKLIELLKNKLQTLDPNAFTDRLLIQRVNVLIDLLRETLLDRYQNLSIRAFVHIASALDYFLILHEEGGVRDTLPGGLDDDLKEIDRVYRTFEREIKAFQEWHARQAKAGY